MAKEVPEFEVPEQLAVCADLLYTTRNQRLEIKKQAEALKAVETKLREHLIASLPNDDSTGIAGKIARVQIVKKEEPQVEDWDAFYKWVSKRKAWDCLQRRISPAAVKARWEERKVVDGVVHFTVVTISLTKVK